MRILMVGLDAAGKTTILYKLKLGEGECNEPRYFLFPPNLECGGRLEYFLLT
jgi:GTPase SAR1 family protein